jgi:hypothetical protein
MFKKFYDTGPCVKIIITLFYSRMLRAGKNEPFQPSLTFLGQGVASPGAPL